MKDDRDRSWKAFYQNQYAHHWQTFSQELRQQPYHVRYQETCLAPIRSIAEGRVLEVGCGRGDLLERFVPASSQAFGCDLSEGNIQAARERFQHSGNRFLIQSDAESLPFHDEQFDVTYSLSVSWYLPNIRAAIDEMFRVTKSGGTIVFDTLNTWHITSLSNHIWRIVCRKMGRELGRTSLTNVSELKNILAGKTDTYHIYGNYLFLPAGLPILKEIGNWCRFVPPLAYAMTETPVRMCAHKLLVIAKKTR